MTLAESFGGRSGPRRVTGGLVGAGLPALEDFLACNPARCPT